VDEAAWGEMTAETPVQHALRTRERVQSSQAETPTQGVLSVQPRAVRKWETTPLKDKHVQVPPREIAVPMTTREAPEETLQRETTTVRPETKVIRETKVVVPASTMAEPLKSPPALHVSVPPVIAQATLQPKSAADAPPRTSPPPTPVEIRIGRIEVRAAAPSPPARPSPAPRAPRSPRVSLTLADYLASSGRKG